MILLRNFINIFNVQELRKKVLFTLGILIIHRLGNHIPLIGIDLQKLQDVMSQAGGLGGVFAYLDLFSGGSLRQCTLFALGISPYITASIMMQLLTLSVPTLEQLSKEGEYGRKIINQYTRYLAIFVSIVQSTGYILFLEKYGLVIDPSMGSRVLMVLSLTVGTAFVMWLGEQISLFGLGSGSSMLIFAGIASRFIPDIFGIVGSIQNGLLDPFIGILVFVVGIGIAAAIVFLEKGERKIPIMYSRRVIGNKVYGGQSTYIPFKINTAGIMPVIFSNIILNLPLFVVTLLAARWTFFELLKDMLTPGSLVHNVLDFALIICFSFLYTNLVFNPEELADNIKKGGGFIPGIRPGKQTADYFSKILTRLGLVGALYLAALALLPNLIRVVLQLPSHVAHNIMSGTGLLIAVGVALDTAAQIESYLIEHRYEGFLTTGRLKGRGGR